MRRLLTFPPVVNEVAARLVAVGAVTGGVLYTVTGWLPVLAALAYGFVARAASGPRFSPLALLVTRVLVPRLGLPDRPVAGPPKRFAQFVGACFTCSALVLALSGQPDASRVVVLMLVGAASLEAFAGFCVGCWIFARLMRIGLVPETVCVACADISRRTNPST